MNIRKPLDTQAVALMLLVCLCMAMQQVALKATADDIAPIFQIALRSGIAALLLGLLLILRKERLQPLRDTWKPGLLVGVLFALEYLLLGESLRLTSSAHAVVFLYTAPVFAALGLHWKLPEERMSMLQWLGIALAFGGIAIAFLIHTEQDDTAPYSLLGDGLALLSAVAWGGTTFFIRTTRLAMLPAKQTLLYQLVVAFVVLLISALLLQRTYFNPTVMALSSLLFQSLIVSFFALLIWFWLLRRYLASRLGVLSFITPLLGVVLGAWLLHEPIEPAFMLGAGMVLSGIILVSGDGWLKHARQQRQTRNAQVQTARK